MNREIALILIMNLVEELAHSEEPYTVLCPIPTSEDYDDVRGHVNSLFREINYDSWRWQTPAQLTISDRATVYLVPVTLTDSVRGRRCDHVLPTNRVFPWPESFRLAIAPLIRKTNHAADL
jgi:hypothetical protein